MMLYRCVGRKTYDEEGALYSLAGGGTAGHINPMLAIARAVRDLEPNAKF